MREGTGRYRERHPIAVRLRSNGEQARRNGKAQALSGLEISVLWSTYCSGGTDSLWLSGVKF